MHNAGGNPPVALDYAPPPPWWRRRVVTGGILAVTCAMAFAAWYWGPALRNHITFRYCQWLCLTYSAPPDQVVYESDPALVKVLLTQPGYITPHYLPMGGGSNYHGPPLIDASKAVYRPAIWDEFVAMTGVSPPLASRSRPVRTAICFLGEVKTPSGQPRLVMVECHPFTFRGGANAMMRGGSIDPGTRITSPMNYVESGLSWWVIQGRLPATLRVFAGQRDPADPMRFSIRCLIDDKEGFIDGRVDEVGVVNLTLREPYPRLPDPLPSHPYQ